MSYLFTASGLVQLTVLDGLTVEKCTIFFMQQSLTNGTKPGARVSHKLAEHHLIIAGSYLADCGYSSTVL